MTELLNFITNHPILTIVLILVVSGCIVEIVKAFNKPFNYYVSDKEDL